MYRTILVPVDGSPLSEYAIPFAIEIARRGGGKVRLFRALADSLIVDGLPVSVQASIRKLAQRDVDKLVKAYGCDVAIEADLRIALPVEAIVIAAARADLVVMTTHGHGGLQRWVTGGVADKVVRMSSKPVLVIQPPPKPTRALAEAAALRMFHDILVPLDGSHVSAQALRELRQFAESGTEIHLLRVLPAGATDSEHAEAVRGVMEAASDLLARGLPVKCLVERNDRTAEALIESARKKNCGLIVMTTHGAGGVERWMLGGITDKVVRHGATPVLAIRASRALWKAGKRPLTARARATAAAER